MNNTFRTIFDIQHLDTKIDYHSILLFIGSCFSENIALKLQGLKFNTLINPFGVIYNPVSISMELAIIMMKHEFTEQDIFLENGVYKSFFTHSRLSNSDKTILLQQMNNSVITAHQYLKTASHLVLTPGTSRVHVLKSNGLVVANNHKQPADLFDKIQLETHQIQTIYEDLISKLKAFNPTVKIIFTVSPVRHLKDGTHENLISKSVLICAAEKIGLLKPDVYYFPAYELMIDDLRDYRFYEKDMLHPNQQAIDYIFEKFKVACIENSANETMKEILDINTAMQHKPFHEKTDSHQKFRQTYFQKVFSLQQKYPALDFKNELQYFKAINYSSSDNESESN